MQFKTTKYTMTFANPVVAGASALQMRETRKESIGRTSGEKERDRGMGERRTGGVQTRQDRGAGGRMAVRIYGRFITLPALPRLL